MSFTSNEWSRRSVLRLTLGAAGLGLGAVVLSSCSSSSGGSGPKSELTVSYGGDPGGLDPVQVFNPLATSILINVLETLAFTNPDGSLRPVIASSWEQLPDPTVWRFKIREGTVFENGEPVDAEAVKFSTERYLQPDAVNDIGRRAGIVRCEVVDQYTVDIITEEPTTMIEALLYRWYIFPPKHYGSTPLSELATKPVGSGPYKLISYVKNDSVILEASETSAQKPAISKVKWQITPEVSTQFANLEVDSAQIMGDIPPDQVDRARGMSDVTVSTADGLNMIFVGIVCREAPLNDVRVRQALNMAVNFDEINAGLLQGDAQRMTITAGGEKWQPKNRKAYAYDETRAKQLLDEAGYSDGLQLDLALSSTGLPNGQQLAETIAQQLAKINVNVTVRPTADSVFQDQLLSDGFSGLYLIGLSSQMYGPKDLQTCFGPTAGKNATGWVDTPKAMEFVEKSDLALQTFDPVEQEQYYQEAADILYDEAPAIFLYSSINYFAARSSVEWTPEPMNEYFMSTVSWREQSL